MAGNNPFVDAANWRLIAEARAAQATAAARRRASAHAANYSKTSRNRPMTAAAGAALFDDDAALAEALPG